MSEHAGCPVVRYKVDSLQVVLLQFEVDSLHIFSRFDTETHKVFPDAESTRIKEPEPESDEPSLLEPNPAEQSSTFAVAYEIVEQCSKRGRPKLIDSQSFTYNMQRQRGEVTDWQSTVRQHGRGGKTL